MVISIIIIIKLLILHSIDFCHESKEQRLKITKIDNVAKILILILVLVNIIFCKTILKNYLFLKISLLSF